MIKFILGLLVTAALADPLPPDRYSIYAGLSGEHPTHPKATAVSALLISGGGSGMGSRPNMSFTQPELPIAYAMYGRKGGTACVDVLPSRTVTVAADGETIPWLNHGFQYDQPLMLNSANVWYVLGFAINPNSFKVSWYPYTAPGVTTPYVAYPLGAGATVEVTPYAHCALGGNGGGSIGDQAIAGDVRGIYFGNVPYARSMYWYGSGGTNILGGGGKGGDAGCRAGGGSPQIGGLDGNAGVDLQGGGGSGAGFMDPTTGGYPITQWGPGSGAGGTCVEISLPLKPSYKFLAPGSALGGEPGPGGFRGGRGGYGMVMFKEKIAP